MTRYTVVRIYQEQMSAYFNRVREREERIDCKTMKEVMEFAYCISVEELINGSYVMDNVSNKKTDLIELI